MKKFSIVIAIVLCVVLSACLFVACQSHQHNFDNWGNDESNHWTVCECGAKNEDSVTAHKDSDNDHKCDLCKAVMSECADNDSDHKCDVCGKVMSACNQDENNDHYCDICGAQLSLCVDEDNDHKCDKCAKVLSECKDDNKDHKCDICGEILSECKDENKDHKCDICGAESDCADKNKDHKCDVCEKVMSECSDADKDHKCDVCEKVMSECSDDNNDHKCDLCGKVLSECSDSDNDYVCDVCGKEIEADHEHQFVFDPIFSNDRVPSSNSDGYCHLTCSVDNCGFERDVVLKYVNIDVSVSVTADSNEYVYFFMMNNYIDVEVPDKAVISVEEGTTLEYVSYRHIASTGGYAIESMNEELVNGIYTFAEKPSAILLRACASDGNISFTLKSAPGSNQENPIILEKNKNYNGSVAKETWFKYTAADDEEIVFCNPNGYDLYTTDGTFLIYAYNIINLKKDQSFYINMYYGNYGFTIVDKESGKSYEGYSPYSAIEMESSPLEVNSTDGTMYYRYVVTQPGRLVIKLNGEAVESIYDSENGTLVGVQYYDSDWEYFYSYYDFPYLSGGEEIYIAVYGAYENGFKLEIEGKVIEEVDNTFIVQDTNGNLLSGVTVTLVDYEENVIESAVTDENGTVVLKYLPGNYEIKLSGYDSSLIYNSQSTVWDVDDASTDKGQTYTIELVAPAKKNVFVKCGDEAISGAEVVVYTSYYMYQGIFSGEIARATTDAEGKAVLEYAIPNQGTNIFIRVENLDSQYSSVYKKVSKTNLDDLTLSVSLAPKYTVSVVIPDGISAELSELSVSCSYWALTDYGTESVVVGSGKLDANGKFEFYCTLIGFDDIDVVVNGLPFNIEGIGVIEYGKYECVVTLSEASLSSLVLGDNTVSLRIDNETDQWPSVKYEFVVEKDGKYTISLDDKQGFAYVKDGDGNFVLSQNYGMLSYSFDADAGDKVYFLASSNNSEESAVSFKLTIAEYVAPVLPELNIGDNDISIESNESIEYIFKSENGGAYTITIVDEKGSAIVSYGDGYWDFIMNDPYEDEPILSYSFTLSAGEYIVLTVGSENYDLDTHNYVLKIQEAQPVTSLSVGDNLVNATYMGTTLTFTAQESGNYIIYSFDENYRLIYGDDEELIVDSMRFSLESEESIDFCFTTNDYSNSDKYVVIIEKLS